MVYFTTKREDYREYKSREYLCKTYPTRRMCTENTKCEKTVLRHLWQDYVEMAEHEEARWNIEPVTSRAFAAYGRVVSGFEEECAALVQAVTEHTPLPERLAYIGLTGENTDVSVQL